MENENQPNQADPSAANNQAPAETQIPLDQLIAERVAEAIQKQKAPEAATAQTSETKEGGSDSEVSSHKDSSTADVAHPNVEALKLVEAGTGRKFASIEDAQKYLANLNSLVGDQTVAKNREEAKLFDNFLNKWASEQGETYENAKKFWADTLLNQSAAKKSEETKKQEGDTKVVDELNSKVSKLEDAYQRGELKAKYPFADSVLDEIALIARSKGVSYIEAFEGSPLKSLAEAKAREDSQKSPVVTSSNRVAINQQRVSELAQKVMRGGNDDDKVALVKQFGEAVGLK